MVKASPVALIVVSEKGKALTTSKTPAICEKSMCPLVE
jgi:hypothetical protein